MHIFKSIALSILLAGVVVMGIGLYYVLFWAGIPYQDPTTEMTIQWMANNLAGRLCLNTGSIIGILGLVLSLAGWFISRRQ